ncbi:helix-turn-helix domain-containing protein [Pseudomonas aeruginosa]
MEKKLFNRLIESVEQMDEIVAGKREPSRTFPARAVQAFEARERTRMSQADFALLIEVSLETLLDWEEGRAAPTGPAQALLRAIYNDPEHLVAALLR